MSGVSRRLDHLRVTFDEGSLVADAGLLLPATVMVRLGLEALIGRFGDERGLGVSGGLSLGVA